MTNVGAGAQYQVQKWHFWIDRGETFTDVMARALDGALRTRKHLTEKSDVYLDAALHAIREVLGVANGAPIPTDLVNSVKMGTTVATNALLEKKGDSTLLAVTTGFRDIIEIGYQSRPRIFNVNIKKPNLVYDGVIEISERILSDGSIEKVLVVKI